MNAAQRRKRGRAAARKRWDLARERERAAAAAGKPKAPASFKVSATAEALAGPSKRAKPPVNIFAAAQFPKGVAPANAKRLAMDSGVDVMSNWAWSLFEGLAAEGQTFLGYPYLAELSQRPEYRRMVEQLAFHMTRRWIRVKHKAATPEGSGVKDKLKRPGFADKGMLPGELKLQKGKDPDFEDGSNPKPPNGAQDAFPQGAGAKPPVNGKTDAPGSPAVPGAAPQPKLSAAGTPLVEPEFTQEDKEREERAQKLVQLENELKRLRVKQHFKEIVELDGFFGRGHLFIDIGASGGIELSTPIGSGKDGATEVKVKKGSLKQLKTVEPMWVYPMGYDAKDPLSPNWYRPDTWYVMSRQVHRTRLLTFVTREVPDILKPAYAFGGLPLIQIAKPYVDNWLKTRQSVADLVQSYSQPVIQTDLLAQMSSTEGSTQLFKRLDVFNNTRNNRGVMALDKEREDFKNVTTPLSSIDKLQAQSQEQMASVSGIPIMFLLGDQPTGLNASSEGAVRAFYDWVQSLQEFVFGDHLDTIVSMAQINIWGKVDPDITYEFVKLWTPTEKEEAEMRKADADRDKVYLEEGVVHADEVREKLAQDPDSGYKLDLSKPAAPPPPEMPPMPGQPGEGDDKPGDPAGGPPKPPAPPPH